MKNHVFKDNKGFHMNIMKSHDEFVFAYCIWNAQSKKNIIWMGLGRGHSMELKEYISDLFFFEIINSVIACTTSYLVNLHMRLILNG